MILRARPPFAGEALLAFLAKRAVPGVEEVTLEGYRRSLRLAHAPGVAELAPAQDGMRVTLHTDPRTYAQLGFTHFFIQPMDGPNAKESLQAAIRFCEVLFGHDYASLMNRAAENASTGKSSRAG